MSETDVIIVGAGLAGLSCARELHTQGISFQIVEASDGVGGRVRTDEVDGFLLDRGFQVLLTAYPETQRVLDYEKLDLRPFYPGSLVWYKGELHKVADPWREPLDGVRGIISPIGTLADKARVGLLRARVTKGSIEELFQQPEKTTLQALRDEGFSDSIIDRFFRPFLGGVFLNRELETSSRLFEFVFRMFSLGETAVPALGIQQIPLQLAAGLPDGAIRLNSEVTAVKPGAVNLTNGETLAADVVVVATEGPVAARLLDQAVEPPRSRSVTCLYFAADEPPITEPILVLNGTGQGLVNNLHVADRVARTYAPIGQHLISVTVLGNPELDDAELETAVRQELQEWFGSQTGAWRHLRTYRIHHAQPHQPPPTLQPPQRTVRLENGLYVCGDYRDNASINGAMISGWRTGTAIAEDSR
jgi:phytoene dehydrogenase-like protein